MSDQNKVSLEQLALAIAVEKQDHQMALWLLSETGMSPNTQKSEYGSGDGVFLYSAIYY